MGYGVGTVAVLQSPFVVTQPHGLPPIEVTRFRLYPSGRWQSYPGGHVSYASLDAVIAHAGPVAAIEQRPEAVAVVVSSDGTVQSVESGDSAAPSGATGQGSRRGDDVEGLYILGLGLGIVGSLMMLFGRGR